MTANIVLKNQTVVITDGKISKIGPSGSINLAKELEIIDGSGKFLMPGIAEMHAHIPVTQEGNDSLVRETLFLYLSNGITTIRGMLGNPYHLTLREDVEDGKILGPRIYTSSPSMNGNSVTTIEEAQEKVAQYKKDGYDFLKIHPGIQLPVFEALVNTAHKIDIPFSGHVPVDVGINRAIDFKYASIDHLDGYIDGLVPAEEIFDPNNGGLFGMNFTDLADPAIIKSLVRKTKEAGIWIVPTQSLLVRWSSPTPGEELMMQPEMQYISPGTRFQWRGAKQNILSASNYTPELAEKFIGLRNQLLKEMEEQGVELLLGSDAPQIYNVPGFSIQHEISAMADAGVSNYTILHSGTANPARFFDAVGKYGTVVEGAEADLLLLEGNPLEDISNMQRRVGVMVKGQWLPKAQIDERLAAIAAKYESN